VQHLLLVFKYLFTSNSSSIIEEVKARRDAGLGLLAYFYFDFRDTTKQGIRGLLSSLLTQLCTKSDPCYQVLLDLYSTHGAGSQQPDTKSLVQCMKDMLELSGQPAIYFVIDALDECPNDFGVVSPREKVLNFIEDLVELHLPNLRICVASRSEADILDILQPLASYIICLHDEEGQKQDIISYINSVVQSDRKMRNWRAEDRQLVINALTQRADGMYVKLLPKHVYLLISSQVQMGFLPIGNVAPLLPDGDSEHSG
jgi:hypothetical protein